MRRVIAVTLATCLFAPTDKSDEERMQGTWELTSITIVGEVRKDIRGRSMKIESRSLTAFQDGRKTRAKGFSIDPSVRPKHIDLTSQDVEPIRGIYELEDDVLKICFFRNLKFYRERPKSLTSDSDHRTTILTYSRRRASWADPTCVSDRPGGSAASQGLRGRARITAGHGPARPTRDED